MIRQTIYVQVPVEIAAKTEGGLKTVKRESVATLKRVIGTYHGYAGSGSWCADFSKAKAVKGDKP